MDDKNLPRLFSRFPMLLTASYFACGVFLARFLVDIFTAAAALSISAVLLITVFRRQTFAVIVPVLFIPLGYFCYQIELASTADHRLKRIYDDGRLASGEPVVLEGTLTGPLEPASGGWRLHVRAEKLVYAGREQLASGIVRLSAPVQSPEMAADYDRLDLRRGSRILFICRLEREAQ